MSPQDKVNILLVDDQPGKLLSYEAILYELNENLVKATSGREALEHLLKSEIAVVLVDVCMPDLDGFQLAAMIREHPRFQKTAMIFISAVHLSEMDRLRGYEMGAVDYVPVPVIPEVLRAKVKVFAELYRKTRQLENLNYELEQRVAERTAELEKSTADLRKSEQRRTLALAAGKMGSWDWDRSTGKCVWDEGQHQIFGVTPGEFASTPESVRALIHPEDLMTLQFGVDALLRDGVPFQSEFRVCQPSGSVRWCIGSAAASRDDNGRIVRISGVTIDITERKEAEERQALLAQEVDHRAKNALALVQSLLRLTKAKDIAQYVQAVEGRINALSHVHAILAQSRWIGAGLRGLVEEELEPYRPGAKKISVSGPDILLKPAAAQTLALVLHELATNAAKYGSLSVPTGTLDVSWQLAGDNLAVQWIEEGGPSIKKPQFEGFGSKVMFASIDRQLGGSSDFDWREGGLHCLFKIPKDKLTVPETPRARQNASRIGSPFRLAKNHRVMIVEDETLVALSLAQSLRDLGFSIVGPFASIAEAELALSKDKIDAAVLDINIAGELVYPLADILAQRKTPFIFTTGYGSENIEQRFQDILILEKPIAQEALHRIFLPH